MKKQCTHQENQLLQWKTEENLRKNGGIVPRIRPGESTAMYIQDIIVDLVPKVTRLARGLPVGGDIEYADQMTIMRALQGRQEI